MLRETNAHQTPNPPPCARLWLVLAANCGEPDPQAPVNLSPGVQNVFPPKLYFQGHEQ
jgi:hypothetical protein